MVLCADLLTMRGLTPVRNGRALSRFIGEIKGLAGLDAAYAHDFTAV